MPSKFNPLQIIQGLMSPLSKMEVMMEAEAIQNKEIHQVLTVDLKAAAVDTAKELRNQTKILTDIRSILREQNKQIAASSSGKGGNSPESATGFKPMGLKDTALTAVMIVGIAAALVGAAAIFTFMPIISPMQLLTALAVAGIMMLIAPVFVRIAEVLGKQKGIMSGGFEGMSFSKTDTSGIWQTAGATLLAMAGIAAALVLSGAILGLMPAITGIQFLTALAIGVVMIPASFAFVKISSIIKKEGLGLKELAMVTASFLAIAGGILGTAWIFQALPDTYKYPDPLWSLIAGFTIFVFAASFSMIMRAVKGATLKELIFGSLAIPIIALSIAGLAWVWASVLPDDYKSPPLMWAAISALSILAFAFSFYLVMKAVKGASLKELIFGSLAIPLIGLTIMGISWIFSVLADEFKAPPYDWSLKVGLALFVMAIPFALITVLFSKMNIGIKAIFMGLLAVSAIAVAILAVSWIFSFLPSTFVMPPGAEWSFNAAVAITLMAVPVVLLGLVATSGVGAAGIVLGAVAVILVAGVIWAVSYILGNIDTGFASGMETLTKGILAPVNGLIDVFKRIKDEIGIENIIPLAGSLVVLAGAWLTLTGALMGTAIGGLASSMANLGSTIIDGISSFFGGKKTKTPFDLVDMLLDKSEAIKAIANPISSISKSFSSIASQTGQVLHGLSGFAMFADEDKSDNLEHSADQVERIAAAYGKFVKSSNSMNIKNVQAANQLFKSIADLAKPDAMQGMKFLTEQLLKAVSELAKTVVSLEDAVAKQEEVSKENTNVLEDVTNGIGNVVSGIKNMVTGANDNVKANTPKDAKNKEAEDKKAMELAQKKLAEDISNMTQALNLLITKFNDTSGTNAPIVRVLR